MTIRIYPSRLPGEPLEVHQHGTITLHDWFSQNVKGWHIEMDHPVSVEISGDSIPSSEWPLCVINHDADVRIYPKTYGLEVATIAWIAVGVAVATAAYSIFMMSNIDSGGYSSSGNGDSLELSPAKANTAKLGDPIREVLGRYKIYPDYVVQPVSRFDSSNPRIYRTNMFLCVGVGKFSISQADIKIGTTPISSFGEDVSYTIYQPGADISADSRTENWYSSTEVGTTTSGTNGIDLGATGPDTISVSASAIMLSGNTVTLIGETSEDSEATNDTEIPASWTEGTVLTIGAPGTYTVRTENGYSVIYGDLVKEINPSVGMAVTLEYNNLTYNLWVAKYTPEVEAVPGVGGNAASITASAAPITYDFSSAPVTFALTWQSQSYTITLSANYTTMSGVVQAVTEQLNNSGLVGMDSSGLLTITEESSPYVGGSIAASSLPTSIFGNSPAFVTGNASSGGSTGVDANVALSYDSATGTPFSGIPDGSQRLSLQHYGWQWQIAEDGIDGLTITVERVLEDQATNATTVDESWPGFSERTLLDGNVTGINDDYDWSGPFLACPDGETTTEFEMNFIFPSGLAHVKNSGSVIGHGTNVFVQYRKYGSTEWTEKMYGFGASTLDAIGFTESISVANGQYEVRVRRGDSPEGGSTRDTVYWQALRSKLSKRPSSYADVTTIALTVRTGNRIAAQSDRRINVIATRLYDDYPSRSISGALHHVMGGLGVTDSEIDIDVINDLESRYWTPRGETFDFSAGDSDTSALDILQKIANAGMGYFLLSDGLMSAGREGVKNWTGIISPQEMTEELQTTFSTPSSDDYDGVDVTYINSTTWAEETVQCRLPDNPAPSKIEDYTLDGVLDQDRAYRIGMRRLQKYRYQRLSHSTSTELDALCYEFMDRIVLTDDIPGSDTISCLVVEMSYDSTDITLTVTEPLDWNFNNPRCLIRHQDGTASTLLTPNRIDDYSFTVPYSEELHPDDWIMNDSSIEPPRVVFCSSERVGYDAIIESIEPGSDGTCSVSAKQYNPVFYQYDDATYPGDVQ
ncbi:kinase [Brenneria sp. 4F2]|nr:kinase [Brenneria bubanii]